MRLVLPAGRTPHTRRTNGLGALPVALLIASVLCLALVVPAARATTASTGNRTTSAAVAEDYVTITATSALSFLPDRVTVTSGHMVHLSVTQAASFNHTFTLSSAANTTIAPTASDADVARFFHAHPPLVNLSLGLTQGQVSRADFPAPAPGSYEYVCLVSTHFAAGMHGELVSQVAGSGTASYPSYGLLSPLVLGGIAAAVVVAVVGAVVALRRRRPPPSNAPTAGGPP